VSGERFDFDILQRVVDQDERTLLDSLKELIAARLVVEESTDQFVFRHALTRQVIIGELLGRERRALHRVIGQAIELQSSDDTDSYTAALAYHFREAGEWPSALVYAQKAGNQALALYAPHAAADHYSRALEAAHNLQKTGPEQSADANLLAEIHLRRGSAYTMLGDFERARNDLETAKAMARAFDNRQVEWQALIDLGLAWASRNYDRAGEHYQAALDLARSIGDSSLLARSLNRVGNWHVNREEIDDSLYAHREAQALFTQLGDQRGMAQTHNFLGVTNIIGADMLQSANHLQNAVTLFEDLDMRDRLASALSNLSFCGGGAFSDVGVPAPMSTAE
jgi:tetratricopeptide (TPR) repeat protein